MISIFLDSVEELKEACRFIRYFVIEEKDNSINLYGIGEREVFVIKRISRTKIEQIRSTIWSAVGFKIFINGIVKLD